MGIDAVFEEMKTAEKWFDENSWLIPDDGGFECYCCDYWIENKGCIRHINGHECE